MKRYYYTDPLKSAWMAREFGVKFISHGGADLIYKGGDDFSVIDCPHGHYAGEYYHVSQDSLPIFEPKVGDMDKSGRVLTKIFPQEIYDNWLSDYDKSLGVVYYSDDEGDDRDMPLILVKIIQRDGKPFFVPEVKDLSVTVWRT